MVTWYWENCSRESSCISSRVRTLNVERKYSERERCPFVRMVRDSLNTFFMLRSSALEKHLPASDVSCCLWNLAQWDGDAWWGTVFCNARNAVEWGFKVRWFQNRADFENEVLMLPNSFAINGPCVSLRVVSIKWPCVFRYKRPNHWNGVHVWQFVPEKCTTKHRHGLVLDFYCFIFCVSGR